MRRIPSLLVLAVVAALFHVAHAPQASAGAVITGQVVQYGGAAVPGTTVRLHADDGGAPGVVVDTETTDDTGNFTLSPTTEGDYWVEVVRNSMVQGGYVSDAPTGPSWVQGDPANATPVTPGTALGRVLALPSYISGVVVNAANGNRLRGIAVNIREVTHLSAIVGSDTTDTNGFFRIPIFGEDFALRLNGSARGFETGWRACNATVVPSWGAACQSPIGRIGKVKLDHL